MLDPKRIRNEPQLLAQLLLKKNFELKLDWILEIDEARKILQQETESLQSERNTRSKMIGKAKAAGEDASEILASMSEINNTLSLKKEQLNTLQTGFNNYLLGVPNIPDEAVPEGKDESSNVLVSSWGTPKQYDFEVLDHSSLGEALEEGMDFASASKITGSRFAVLLGGMAKLHRALIQFMLNTHTTEHGYQEIYVPFIVNSESLRGTGQLPKFEEDLFKLRGDQDYYLIPTAEVPVSNMVRDEIIDAAKMPLKFVSHTPCFRSEAGSYGKDTKGLIRQHQFEKVELIQMVASNESEQALEDLTAQAEKILQLLELPYQKVLLCGGDLGFSARKTYDLEVWLPSQDCYREISSCSNCGDFQARRMQARWRNPATGKPELMHTLNGSGLAVGRTLVAIMENNQESDGRIKIPSILVPYMNGQEYLS